MNKDQREKHKASIRVHMARKRQYNKEHPEEVAERRERQKLERKVRLTRNDRRRIKRIKKKRSQRLKTMRKRGEIDEAEYKRLLGKV